METYTNTHDLATEHQQPVNPLESPRIPSRAGGSIFESFSLIMDRMELKTNAGHTLKPYAKLSETSSGYPHLVLAFLPPCFSLMLFFPYTLPFNIWLPPSFFSICPMVHSFGLELSSSSGIPCLSLPFTPPLLFLFIHFMFSFFLSSYKLKFSSGCNF